MIKKLTMILVLNLFLTSNAYKRFMKKLSLFGLGDDTSIKSHLARYVSKIY